MPTAVDRTMDTQTRSHSNPWNLHGKRVCVLGLAIDADTAGLDDYLPGTGRCPLQYSWQRCHTQENKQRRKCVRQWRPAQQPRWMDQARPHQQGRPQAVGEEGNLQEGSYNDSIHEYFTAQTILRGVHGA